MPNDIQDFDKAALAEFGCRMCHNARHAHGISHGLPQKPCVWRRDEYGAENFYGCDALKLALTNFLKETL